PQVPRNAQGFGLPIVMVSGVVVVLAFASLPFLVTPGLAGPSGSVTGAQLIGVVPSSLVRANQDFLTGTGIYWLMPLGALLAAVIATLGSLIRPQTRQRERLGGILCFLAGVVGSVPFVPIAVAIWLSQSAEPSLQELRFLGAGFWITAIGTMGILLGGVVAWATM